MSQLFPFANRGVSPKMRDLAATRGQRRSLAVCFARASLPASNQNVQIVQNPKLKPAVAARSPLAAALLAAPWRRVAIV